MSLNLQTTKPDTVPTPAIARLPDSMLTVIAEYANALAAKRKAEADARAADNVVKKHLPTILAAMGNSETAICGAAVLSKKQTAAAAAALTLVSGAKVPWSDVTGVLKGNEHIPAGEISTIYGGRSGSTSIDVKGI